MMKKLSLMLALCCLVTTTIFAQSPYGKLVKGVVKSDILKTEKPYVAFLPDGYDSTGNVKYPVLYLLHGAWGNCNSWVDEGNVRVIASQVIEMELALPMIIIMPDARGVDPKNFGGKHMGYFNQPGWRYEDFFFQEFIPEIEKRYQIDAQKKSRAISGLSMGGGGSAAYAQRHPEMFGSAAPLSGLLGDFEGSKAMSLDDDFNKSVLETAPLLFVQNATEAQIEDLKSVRWYIDCGDDDYLYDANVKMFVEMRKRNIPLQFRMRDGEHTWVYWKTALPSVLEHVSIGFKK